MQSKDFALRAVVWVLGMIVARGRVLLYENYRAARQFAFLACMVASAGTALAQGGNPVEQHNKEVVQRSFDAWQAGTGSPYNLLADDANWTIVGNSVASKTYTSRAEFVDQVIKPFNARMLGRFVPTIRNIYAEGDTVIVFFDAAGTALDGKPYRNTYAWFLDMHGDKITRAFAFFDSVAFNDFWQRIQPAHAH